MYHCWDMARCECQPIMARGLRVVCVGAVGGVGSTMCRCLGCNTRWPLPADGDRRPDRIGA